MGSKNSGRIPTGPKWYASRKSYFVTFKGTTHNLGPDKEIATIKFHDLIGGTVADPGHEVRSDVDYTVAELFDLYLDFVQRERKASTYNVKRLYLQQFTNDNKRLSNRLAVKILPRHLTEWCERHPNWGSTYRHTLISAIQGVYSWAVRNKILAVDPVRGMDKPSPKKKGLGRYTKEKEFKQLLEVIPAADEGFRNLLVFIWETGCRPFEACRLRFTDIDFADGKVVVENRKAKGIAVRTIILTDRAIEAVKASGRTTGVVFLNQRKNAYTKDSVGHKLRQIAEKHGIKITAYDIRHGFATRIIKDKKDAALASTLMGNSVRTVVDTYSHLLNETAYLREQLQGGKKTATKKKKSKKKKKAKKVSTPFYPVAK